MFPPSGLGWFRWLLWPWFPSRVLVLAEGDVEEVYYDDEILGIVEGRGICIVKLRKGNSVRSIAVSSDNIFNYSQLYSPRQIFGNYTMKWILYVYTLFYYLVYSPLVLFPELVSNPLMVTLAVALIMYIVLTYRSFTIYSIEYIKLHRWGNWGSIPLFVPGPRDHSKLSFSQVMKKVGYINEPRFKDDAIEDLSRKLEILNDENLRLQAVIAELEKRMGNMYERAIADVALLAPGEVIEKIRSTLALEYKTKYRMLIALIIILAPLMFAVGYLLAGGGIAVETAPPSTQVVYPGG